MRFALPSGVRGIPGVFRSSHWASAGIVATVAFSHPVDTRQFETHVSLNVERDAQYLGLTPDSRHFTVLYDKFRLAAYVHSAALAMPRDDTPITLRVDKGVRAARGGNATADRLAAVVIVPGRASLRFTSTGMTIVDNARYEPEQVLLTDVPILLAVAGWIVTAAAILAFS